MYMVSTVVFAFSAAAVLRSFDLVLSPTTPLALPYAFTFRILLHEAVPVRVLRCFLAGFAFGGRVEAIRAASQLHDDLITSTLSDALMGTDDTLLTILAHQFPDAVRFVCMECFYDAVANRQCRRL